MKILCPRTVTVAAVFSLAAVLFAQAPSPGSSIEGVWKIVEVVTTGPNASTNDNPWPSVVIFTRRYFSYVSVDGVEPRPRSALIKTPGKPTDDEKIATYEEWNPFTTNAGTYNITGTTLFLRPVAGKREVDMGFRVSREFTLEGNTLWLVTKSPTTEIRTKLTRLEP